MCDTELEPFAIKSIIDLVDETWVNSELDRNNVTMPISLFWWFVFRK